MAIHVLDRYYLAITALVTIGYQLLGFFVAWTFQFDKITDFTGGSNFFILAILTLCLGDTFFARNIVASILVMVWATRIAGFLLFRVLKMGSDTRFDEIRSSFFSFFLFWIGQMLWVWTVSLSVTILNSPAVSDTAHGGSTPPFGSSRDVAGIVLWGIGWTVESLADAQKYHFKSSKPPKEQPINTGLWAWSRHPPYFGEILCWWGIWILCLSPTTNGSLGGSPTRAQYGAIMSPIFTTILLLFGSGLPTAEKPTAERFYLLSHSPSNKDMYPTAWEAYKEHLRSTSIIVPLPRTIYRPLPLFLKRWLLLDLPLYQFNEKTDGPAALRKNKQNHPGSSVGIPGSGENQ